MLDLQRGDETAFDRLVLHYQGSVRRFVHRYVREQERAEDLSQEVFLRVWRARRRYRPAAGFRTWLFTIATRLCLNDLRSRRRERRVIVPMPRPREEAGAEEEFIDGVADRDSPDAEESARALELAQALDAALEELPPAQRTALLLLRHEELSYREIADVLGISLMAVKSLINRGREGLRARLEARGMLTARQDGPPGLPAAPGAPAGRGQAKGQGVHGPTDPRL